MKPIKIKTSLIQKIRDRAEQGYHEIQDTRIVIDRCDREWSLDFIRSIIRGEQSRESLKNFLRERKSFVSPYPEDPYDIFTYDEMCLSDPSQEICGKNEVVLSLNWVGDEEKIQVLTYEELESAAEEVLSGQIIETGADICQK